MANAATSRQRMPLWFAIALPAAWLIGLLSIGFLQLLVDPDAQNPRGELLDQLSWFLWLGGLVLVPAVSAFVARRHELGWPGTIGVAVVGSLIYAAGTLLVFAVWIAGYESVTGVDWN